MDNSGKALVQTTGRRPRGAVLVNGQRTPGWVSFEVENTVYYEADTFRLQFAAAALPKGFGVDWFAAQATLAVELFAGVPANPDEFAPAELQRLLVGRADMLQYDAADGLLCLSGRDLTGVLIDAQASTKWMNRTASDIVTDIAQANGLTPVVVATRTKVGTYTRQDQVRQQDRRSAWDLLVWLAAQEGFAVYVRGQALHFEPQAARGTAPYALVWQPAGAGVAHARANVLRLNLRRTLALAQGVAVTVQSVHNPDGKSYSATVPAGGDNLPNRHLRHVVNQRPGECLKQAQAIYAQLTRHALQLEATLPGDAVLNTGVPVQLSGTGTGFDQTYWPLSVQRSLSAQAGYVMRLRASNASPSAEDSM